jgi:membrane protease subunit HflC
LIIVVILGVIFASGVFYIVKEGEQVVITEFGRPIGEPIVNAGLKFKTPFIQDVHRFEKRILEWDGKANQIPTKDKKFIWLDTTARWRIKDALQFYQALGTEVLAQSRLDDIIDSAARDLVTAQLLIEVVRNSNRVLDPDREILEDEEGQRVLDPDREILEDEEGQSDEPLEEIQIGREKITQMIREKAQEALPRFGIELVDVQVKRINYVEEVRQKVFDRMISERQRISEKYKSEGEGEAANIMGQKQKELERIQSEAYKEAEQLKGDADAQAIQIYAEAHGKDPEFFAFLQTLETYRKTSTASTKLILTTDSELYKYLKDSKALKR